MPSVDWWWRGVFDRGNQLNVWSSNHSERAYYWARRAFWLWKARSQSWGPFQQLTHWLQPRQAYRLRCQLWIPTCSNYSGMSGIYLVLSRTLQGRYLLLLKCVLLTFLYGTDESEHLVIDSLQIVCRLDRIAQLAKWLFGECWSNSRKLTKPLFRDVGHCCRLPN